MVDFKVIKLYIVAMLVKYFFIALLFVFYGKASSMEEELDLKQKAGQLLIVGYEGTKPEDPGVQAVMYDVRSSRVGGVIAFGRNLENVDQIRRLNKALAMAAEEVGLPTLIRAVDQEGGCVQRLKPKHGFPETPAAKELAVGTVDAALACYKDLAHGLRDVGFNWNFAPCVDLDLAGEHGLAIGKHGRSYGPDVATVELYGGAMIDGLNDAGCLSCVKHYPGHGSAKGDTHHGFIDVTEVWREEELLPFYSLVERAGAVMTAHVFNKNLDPANPATLSPLILNNLREHCPDVVIVSDCMQMQGIQQACTSFSDGVIRALKAGIDQIVYANNPIKHGASCTQGFEPGWDFPQRFVDIVLNAIESEQITEVEINEKLSRIMALKSRLAKPL